ncbi:hypothetical protein ACHQM5_013488 [Ranunculus cassubicifolius]
MEISVQMNGGDGLYSYSHNSSYQRKAVDAAKKFISKFLQVPLQPQPFVLQIWDVP